MDNNEKLKKSFCVGGAAGITNSKGELVTTHIVITEEGSSVMGKPSGIYPVENTKQTSDYYLDELPLN